MKQVITIPGITNYTLAIEDNKLYYKLINTSDENYIPISSDIDLSNYYMKDETDELLNTKDNKLEYITTTNNNITLSSNMFCYANKNGGITNINYYIPSTLTNAVCRFKTGSSITYSITYDSNIEINKTILLEPNTSYVFSVNKTIMLWQEVITAY